MERSGSQKFLLVVSIISIILGVLVFAMGLMVSMAGGILGAATAAGGSALTVDEAQAVGVGSFVASAGGVVFVLLGVYSVVEGVLGVRAANDATKVMPVWVLAIIGIVLAVISVIMSITSGSFGSNILNNVLTLAINGFMFWICNNIKTEGGR